jgi:hypothetical protein
MAIEYPKMGEAVTGPCLVCNRDPRQGETYGPHAEGWDATFKEEDDGEPE